MILIDNAAKRRGAFFPFWPSVLLVFLGNAIMLSLLAGNAHAVARGVSITYQGGGAGAVVFNGTVHADKGFSCAHCHEAEGFSLPLFKEKFGADTITMKKMERGRNCGACHKISMEDTLNCGYCHQK